MVHGYVADQDVHGVWVDLLQVVDGAALVTFERLVGWEFLVVATAEALSTVGHEEQDGDDDGGGVLLHGGFV